MPNFDTVVTVFIVGFAAAYILKKFFFDKDSTGCSCSGHKCGGQEKKTGKGELSPGNGHCGCVDKNCSGE